MKKIIAIIATLLVVFPLLYTNVFAEGESANTDYVDNLPAPDATTVIRVAGLNKSGELVLISDESVFHKGWNTAMNSAKPDKLKDKGYASIVVTLYADWNADSKGVFHEDGTGFDWDTIYVPENAKVILNLNGHTINRGLTEWENNGEVIAIDEGATVVINGGKDSSDPTEGKITGGYSAQFGGGIHIKEDANVTLNNVNVVGNRVEDASGAGVSVAKGTTFTMNGGSVSNNKMAWTYSIVFFNDDNFGIGVYASSNSTLVFNDVDFESNIVKGGSLTVEGAAIYTRSNADLTVNNCNFKENGIVAEDGMATKSLITTNNNCDVVIKDSVFKNNGCVFYEDSENVGNIRTNLLDLRGNVLIEGCTFEENKVGIILDVSNACITLKDSTFTNNNAINVLYFAYSSKKDASTISGCTFKDNIQEQGLGDYNYSFYFFDMKDKSKLTFTADNVFGDEVTFSNKSKATFLTEESDHVGSILGTGSISMIVSIVALCVSAGTAVMFYISKKKNNEHPAEAPRCADLDKEQL